MNTAITSKEIRHSEKILYELDKTLVGLGNAPAVCSYTLTHITLVRPRIIGSLFDENSKLSCGASGADDTDYLTSERVSECRGCPAFKRSWNMVASLRGRYFIARAPESATCDALSVIRPVHQKPLACHNHLRRNGAYAPEDAACHQRRRCKLLDSLRCPNPVEVGH